MSKTYEAESTAKLIKSEYEIDMDTFCEGESELIRKYTLDYISREVFEEELRKIYESYANSVAKEV